MSRGFGNIKTLTLNKLTKSTSKQEIEVQEHLNKVREKYEKEEQLELEKETLPYEDIYDHTRIFLMVCANAKEDGLTTPITGMEKGSEQKVQK